MKGHTGAIMELHYSADGRYTVDIRYMHQGLLPQGSAQGGQMLSTKIKRGGGSGASTNYEISNE